VASCNLYCTLLCHMVTPHLPTTQHTRTRKQVQQQVVRTAGQTSAGAIHPFCCPPTAAGKGIAGKGIGYCHGHPSVRFGISNQNSKSWRWRCVMMEREAVLCCSEPARSTATAAKRLGTASRSVFS